MENTNKSLWDQGKENELKFWDSWFATQGREWPEDYKRRFDLMAPINPHISRCVYCCQKPIVHVLEVGCGPVTGMGYTYPAGFEAVNTIYSDPLADKYTEFYTRYRLHRPHPILKMPAEEIHQYFAPMSFDVVVATNCLDHGYAPSLSLINIGWAIKRGGFFYFHHVIDAAVREHHQGLHQWNFCITDGTVQLRGNDNIQQPLTSLLNMREQVIEVTEDWITAIYEK